MKTPLTFFLSLIAPQNPFVSAINDARHQSGFISAINVSFDPKAEWSLLRYGVYPNKVGLQIFDREAATAMVSAFNDRLNRLANAFRGLPAYVGHPDDPEWAAQNPGVRAEALGRIREMKASDEGLLFRVAYNDEGKRLVTGEAPAYEAYSPNWGMLPITYKGRKAFRPVELNSIGLTNQPNIPGSYIGLNEALPAEVFPMKAELIKLLAALGYTLAADANDEAIVAGINEALPKSLAAIAAQGELTTTKAQLTAAQNEVTTLKGTLTSAQNEATSAKSIANTERKERAGLVIVTAINEGRLTQAQRAEWEAKFMAPGADFTAVSGELAKLKKAVNTTSKSDGMGARRGADVESQKKINAVNEAVTAKMASAKCDRPTAYNAVRAEKPELFAES